MRNLLPRLALRIVHVQGLGVLPGPLYVQSLPAVVALPGLAHPWGAGNVHKVGARIIAASFSTEVAANLSRRRLSGLTFGCMR